MNDKWKRMLVSSICDKGKATTRVVFERFEGQIEIADGYAPYVTRAREYNDISESSTGRVNHLISQPSDDSSVYVSVGVDGVCVVVACVPF